jgi:hypothetical protein
MGVGYGMRTGYPVIVVVVKIAAEVQAMLFFRMKRDADTDMGLTTCMMTGRNNKMKYLIAKYF